MRKNHRFVLMVLGALVLYSSGVAAQSNPCAAASPTTARTITKLQQLVTATDSAQMAYRDSVGLPATAASNVTLMSQSNTCNNALTAFNASWSTSGVARTLNVYKISTFYGVEDVALATPGDYRAIHIYDKHWNQKGIMARRRLENLTASPQSTGPLDQGYCCQT